jgi:hypothetical protein
MPLHYSRSHVCGRVNNVIVEFLFGCDRRYFGFLRWGRNQVSGIVILIGGFLWGETRFLEICGFYAIAFLSKGK